MTYKPHTMDTQNREGLDFFVDSWAVYKKLVAENYMFHRQIYAEVKALLAKRSKPFNLLDLGCGDALHLAGIAGGLPISHYDGVDLSPVALKLAKQNLQDLKCQIQLHTGDMLFFLESNESQHDIIFTSYAFHHLSQREMRRFLTAACRHLRPGGQLVLVDVIREQGQSLADYLDAFCEDMRRQWLKLSPEELDHAIRHVRDCDQPPTLEQLREIALQAGLDDFHPVYRKDWYQLITLGSRVQG